MTCRVHDRLEDITAAAQVIREHLTRGPLTDGLVFDAARVRLVEIGEAVKAIPSEMMALEPDVPWRDVSAMRDFRAHCYFDTAFAVLQHTVEQDLPLITAAVERIRDHLPAE